MLNYLGTSVTAVYTIGGESPPAAVFALRFILITPTSSLPKSELGWLQDERVLPYWTYDARF